MALKRQPVNPYQMDDLWAKQDYVTLLEFMSKRKARAQPTSVKQRKAVKKVAKLSPESVPLRELTAGMQQGGADRVARFVMAAAPAEKKKQKQKSVYAMTFEELESLVDNLDNQF